MEEKKRLEDIIRLVDKNKSVIDIGTDHGLVPLYLAKNNISTDIVATDISEKSLNKLREALDDELKKIIKTHVTDGFKGLEKKPNQVAIIAGMGANNIIDIINNDLDFAHSLDYMILESNVNTEKLRGFLLANNFYIERDFMSLEKEKYYDILKVRTGKASKAKLSETYYPKDDIAKRSPILEEKLRRDYEKNLFFRDQIIKNSSDKKALAKINLKIQAIEEVYEIWKLEKL
ncbi:MAG: class I SAM-dependent methyltransferase [Anaerococcus sp.]|nr:class I SAM-dependent methyltransferase [Anaerococcus sp.]MDD7044811.1 class I SAM-dependent methyltransferase [Peptoniphilaceae bacterium]MDY2919368.1 class I SAM-dependent methyltransferase [Anaerococcus sp.]